MFLCISGKSNQISIHSSFKSYIYKATKNACLNHIKSKHFQHNSLNDELTENLPEIVSADTHMEYIELEHKIQDAINSLPEKCKIIYCLCKNNNLTYKEVAEELDISIKTVENQMTIALRKLRAYLLE